MRLARAHGIVTPYTSYLIVEDEERRGIPADRRSFSSVSRNRELREQLADGFGSFSKSKSGIDALVGASSARSLKSAEKGLALESADLDLAITNETYAAAPAAPAPVFSAPSPIAKSQPGSGKPRQNSRPTNAVLAEPNAESKKDSTGREDTRAAVRNIAGKTFYLNDGIWVDSEAQQLKDIKPTKIKFGSDEYFKLLQTNDDVQQWLSIGTRCQVVIDGNLYEIEE